MFSRPFLWLLSLLLLVLGVLLFFEVLTFTVLPLTGNIVSDNPDIPVPDTAGFFDGGLLVTAGFLLLLAGVLLLLLLAVSSLVPQHTGF